MRSKASVSGAVSRRQVLRGLVALPVFSALLPAQRVFAQTTIASSRNRRPVLQVYCHGLHAYVFYPDHILLLTPHVPDHKYLAGAWRNETEMKQGEPYSLTGVGCAPDVPGRRPVINRNNLFLPGVETIRADKSYCQVNLPLPDQFISLRYVKANFEGKSPKGSIDVTQSSEFPLLQILQYEVYDLPNLRLEGLASWQPNRESSLQQLHIFAEPQAIVPEDHASRAFDALIEMFPGFDLRLKSKPGPPVCPSPDPNDVLGLALEQEMSLAERDYGCPDLVARLEPNVKIKGKGKGSQPVNCFSVIVNAPQT